jgi:hypothetical protein
VVAVTDAVTVAVVANTGIAVAAMRNVALNHF